MESKINIGIIGSEGKIGKKRYELCRQNINVDKIKLCDIKFGDNYKDFIEDKTLDGVFMCTTHNI